MREILFRAKLSENPITGKRIKNGRKVFEGDIVKARNTFHDRDEIFFVRWAEENGFYFTDDCGTNWHHDHLADIEVIGNIFDDSELARK